MPWQHEKAPWPMPLTLDGIAREIRFVQERNAKSPMFVTPDGKTIFVNPENSKSWGATNVVV